MYNPIATYRIQFHKDFNFEDFEQVVGYLQKLGVKTIYASPILASTTGSTHGYDGIDPETIDPEIGGETEFRRLTSALKTNGIGWLQDIVPNHMAFDMSNKWLWDVLEKGQESECAAFFDIAWNNADDDGKLMVPFLGEPIDELIRKGDVKIGVKDGERVLDCYGVHYPLNRSSVELIEDVDKVNADKGLLHSIIDQQYYRLCHWQETDAAINYRRFFTINGLICLNIQDKEVLDKYHQLIERLVKEGLIDGLRIDHIDGLYDPKSYLDDLRKMAGDETYISVEKILAKGEDLEKSWATQGTTGYDFLAVVNNLFTNGSAKEKFEKFYRQFTGDQGDVEAQIRDKKSSILYNHMQGELSNLLHLFKSSDLLEESEYQSVTDEELKGAIGEFLVRCPVYRFYGERFPLAAGEGVNIRVILDEIELGKPELSFAVGLLRRVMLEKPLEENEEYCGRVLHFYRRCMQFTGPLMAKGVEDTLMYTYNNFIGHNDVGDAPDAFGYSVEEFHQFMADRRRNWPLALNATSTHDTKRGEDSRARLAVITDIAEDWIKTVKGWHKLMKSSGGKLPDRNDEYFIYQSLVGVYPMDSKDGDVEERMQAYLKKALREGKRNSDWASPNVAYEDRAKAFVSMLLKKDNEFYRSFHGFFSRIIDHGVINSLSQVMLRFTCPGIPDIYQGTELWDLSLVDPDNRRPVDYGLRSDILNGLQDDSADLKGMWGDRQSGKIKLWLTHKLLLARSQSEDAFRHGLYVPIEIKGRYKDNVIAFARVYQKQWFITVAPLHTAMICSAQKCDVLDIDWSNTRLVLPEHAPVKWEGLLTDAAFGQGRKINVGDIFSDLPLEMLVSVESNNARKAGVLAAVSSLPSQYGVGDMGPAAYQFADFLHRSCQTYWQLLPLNPIAASSAYSPYSSISAMAGNVLLISPELLLDAGLLEEEDLSAGVLPSNNIADYGKAEEIKARLLEKAYRRYRDGDFPELRAQFERFCELQKCWIDDYAMFVVLKQQFGGAPWYEWPDEYRLRDSDALKYFQLEHKEEINVVKWYQFIFSVQWKDLKHYCNTRGIKLFGDIPFYTSHDSADVWARPEFFTLDKFGQVAGIAGVPPDYFSEDGQLWGMPTFNWEQLKATNYEWWIERFKRNLELFDLIRLDHFRAFAEYWQVPEGEITAQNGKWLKGPGKDFFDVVNEQLGGLPFVAEDLGDNMDAVYALRDEVGLPGMRVLQFAFDENMPDSVDIPHNYPEHCIVYTGTHDNNTTIGWFGQESSKANRKRMQAYIGAKVTDSNIHRELSRMAYASVAQTAILPLQDVIGLGEESRMNTPGSGEGNWLWRFTPDQLIDEMERQLREWARTYNRC